MLSEQPSVARLQPVAALSMGAHLMHDYIDGFDPEMG